MSTAVHLSEDVLRWPEWRSFAKKLGVPEVDHPLKIVLTIEAECPVHVEHHYFAGWPDPDEWQPTPRDETIPIQDVSKHTMRRQDPDPKG
jgi:hypothetical protein